MCHRGRFGLTDRLLDGPEWVLAGAPRTDDAVAVRCEPESRETEATLAGGDEVDVEGLIELLTNPLHRRTSVS